MAAALLLAPMPFARAAEAAPRSAANARAGADIPASTPELLERAVAEGALDPPTAGLYLAYAMAEPAKLPARFRSQAPWRGTVPLLDLRTSIRRDPSDPALAGAARVLDAASGPEPGARA